MNTRESAFLQLRPQAHLENFGSCFEVLETHAMIADRGHSRTVLDPMVLDQDWVPTNMTDA